MISGDEQNPLKCLSNLEEIWNGIVLIFYPLITHSTSLNNRCDRTQNNPTYSLEKVMKELGFEDWKEQND